ncbi:MAG TPA: potassium channel family protein [Burkholderiales bacterium]|nr:potassium channel family protein [Burkholderiales bacterium]
MPIDDATATVVLTVRQRCFYLFCALLLLAVAVPFLEGSPRGRQVLNAISLGILIASACAIGRSMGALVIALLLAAPAAVFQVLSYYYGEPRLNIMSQGFAAVFYAVTISYLMVYTLQRKVLTMDKLYGAAAVFLMLGILWAYLYNILLWGYPGALTMSGAPMNSAPPSSMLYFSIATLTATGMSDILPVHPVARILCAFEMIVGVLFLAVLIARLAGNYPPPAR